MAGDVGIGSLNPSELTDTDRHNSKQQLSPTPSPKTKIQRFRDLFVPARVFFVANFGGTATLISAIHIFL